MGRRVRSGDIVLVAATWCAASLVVNYLGSRDAVAPALGGLHRLTKGLVEPTLLAGLAALVASGTVILVIGGLRPRDVGFIRTHLGPALLTFLVFWMVMQISLAGVVLAAGESLEFHSSWNNIGAGTIIGGVLGQLFGNALAEETVFRGFFLTQLRWIARPLGRRTSAVVAVFGSTVLFALSHLPNRLLIKAEFSASALALDQLKLVVAGLFLALAFLATRNLFTTVGFHALANDPAPLIGASDAAVRATFLVLLSVVILGAGCLRGLRNPTPAVGEKEPVHRTVAPEGRSRRRGT